MGAVDVATNKTDKLLASFHLQGSDTLIQLLTPMLDQIRLSFAAPNSHGHIGLLPLNRT